MANQGALVRGKSREELFLLHLREGHFDFFKAPFAHLSKVVVFGCDCCTDKGDVERGTSLALLEREGQREALYMACFACLSEVVVLVAIVAPVRGM